MARRRSARAHQRHANGTGADIARGAMGFGATAREAVMVASELDLQTGGGVDVVRLR